MGSSILLFMNVWSLYMDLHAFYRKPVSLKTWIVPPFSSNNYDWWAWTETGAIVKNVKFMFHKEICVLVNYTNCFVKIWLFILLVYLSSQRLPKFCVRHSDHFGDAGSYFSMMQITGDAGSGDPSEGRVSSYKSIRLETLMLLYTSDILSTVWSQEPYVRVYHFIL